MSMKFVYIKSNFYRNTYKYEILGVTMGITSYFGINVVSHLVNYTLNNVSPILGIILVNY